MGVGVVSVEGAGCSSAQRRAEEVKRLLGRGTEPLGLDYEFDAWHLGVIAVGEGVEDAVRELARGMDRRLLSVFQGEQRVWAWLGGRDRPASVDVERFTAGMDGMRSRPPAGVVFALGEPAWGFDGWRMTHRQAQAALMVALRRGGWEGVTFTRYADVALLAGALKDEMLAGALVEVYLAPLDDSHSRGVVLRETLRAYLTAGGNTSSAAAALRVNRSTVESRLRTVEQSLGRQLPACLPELEVALRLEELGLGDATDAQRPPRF
jgi:sugar diacid utilization regulator